jgi:glycosyltransferase involved in cell wall biosynthesis
MQVCYLFTQYYPFTDRETFVHAEIDLLAKRFDRLVLLPLETLQEPVAVPDNVQIEVLFANIEDSISQRGLWWKIKALTDMDLFLDIAKNWKYLIKKKGVFREYLSLFVRNKRRAEIFGNYLKNGPMKQPFFYNYWFDNWATVLALHKKKDPEFSFVSRVHGFEVFRNQTQHGFFAMRDLQMRSVDALYAVSRVGKETMVRENPRYRSKIRNMYLGSADHGTGPFEKAGVFSIVSCAHIGSIKRVHLIGESLYHFEGPAIWYHIGGFFDDDPGAKKLLENCVQKLQERPNIQVRLLGKLSNTDIMDFYRTTPVNLFVSLSSTEGVPFTFMEANSFGIPVLSTDVGGCAEIVVEETGLLVQKDESPESIAAVIRTFKASAKNDIQFRKGVRKYWEKHFSIGHNLSLFCDEMGATKQDRKSNSVTDSRFDKIW